MKRDIFAESSQIKIITLGIWKRQFLRKIMKIAIVRCLPDNSFCFILDFHHNNFKNIKNFLDNNQHNLCLFNIKTGKFFEFCPKIFNYGFLKNFKNKSRNHLDFIDSGLCVFDAFQVFFNLDKPSLLVLLTAENFLGNQFSYNIISKRVYWTILLLKKISSKIIYCMKKSFLKYQKKKTVWGSVFSLFFFFFFFAPYRNFESPRKMKGPDEI